MKSQKLKFTCPACTSRVVLSSHCPSMRCPQCDEQLELGRLLGMRRQQAKNIATCWLGFLFCLFIILVAGNWLFAHRVPHKFTPAEPLPAHEQVNF